MCGGIPLKPAILGGAYVGSHPLYLVQARIPQVEFSHAVPAVAVAALPPGFDGIACFQFLNRFTYGNFSDESQFGLKTR